MSAKFYLSLLIAAGLTGCGTMITVAAGDKQVRSDLRKANTYCESIPRVYSGIAYDFCILNAGNAVASTGVAINGAPLALLDFGFSGVLDTVVLPYTIPKQISDGEIFLR